MMSSMKRVVAGFGGILEARRRSVRRMGAWASSSMKARRPGG